MYTKFTVVILYLLKDEKTIDTAKHMKKVYHPSTDTRRFI